MMKWRQQRFPQCPTGGFHGNFRLDHPPDREDFACAAHTSSVRHASVLPKGLPSVEPHRIRPAA